MNLYHKNLPGNQITANSRLIEVSSFQAPLASIDFGKLFQQYNNPQGWIMIGGMLFVLLLLQISGTGKGKITTGKVSGISEKLAATNLALKQIKEHKHNKVTLWSGTPRYWVKGKWRSLITNLQTMLGASPSVWFPNAERGTLVICAPRSGKT